MFRPKEVTVYNCSTGDQNPLSWGRFRDIGFEAWMDEPGGDIMWYPSISFISGEWNYRIAAVLYHYIPAYTLDFLARILGKQPNLVCGKEAFLKKEKKNEKLNPTVTFTTS